MEYPGSVTPHRALPPMPPHGYPYGAPAFNPYAYNPYHPNPLSRGALIGLWALGIVVIGGAIYYGMKSAAAAQPAPTPAPTPTPSPVAVIVEDPPFRPIPPIEPPRPKGPIVDENVLEDYDTVVGTVKLIESTVPPGGEVPQGWAPYRVLVEHALDIPLEEGEFGFPIESAARTFAERRAYLLGAPESEDDTLVDFAVAGENAGGGVWQSVTEGDFYISWSTPESTGIEGPYEGIDEAAGALMQRLGLVDGGLEGEETPAEDDDVAHAQISEAPPAQAQITPIP